VQATAARPGPFSHTGSQMDTMPLRDRLVGNLVVLLWLAACLLLRGVGDSRPPKAAAHAPAAADLPQLAQGPAR
jgi:hypothetical protein